MSLLVFAVVVIIVTALIMWLIYYVPLPPDAPPFIKNVGYIIVLIVAILVIVGRAGWLGAV